MVFNEGGESVFLIAVGYEDGKVVLVNAENAEMLFTTKIIDFGAPITAMHWQDAPMGKGAVVMATSMGMHLKSMQTIDGAKMKPDVV